MRIKKMESLKSKLGGIVGGTLVGLLTGANAVLADDTEVFTAYTSTSPNSNVVFVLDTSGSMAHQPQGQSNGPSKIQIVKDVFEKLIFDPNNPTDHTTLHPSNQGLQFALMRFDEGDSSNSDGGYFITRMQSLNNGTKLNFWDAVNGLSANGWTPLAETAYEAARYFRGDTEYFGANKNDAPGIAQGNGTYQSPFRNLVQSDDCAINNHLVILTDGLPTKDGDADTMISDLTGSSCSFVEPQASTAGSDCLPQIAQYLRDTDFLPDIAGVQNVRTHTIAFDINDANAIALLQQTAQNGDGVFLSATGSGQLSDAITEVIRNVVRSARSFVTPTVSHSDSSRFTHDNNVYFSLFEPEASPKWTGNMKNYQYNEAGELVDFSAPPIPVLDANGDINPSAKSNWSGTVVDGAEIGAGGAAGRIGLSARTIYTQNANNGIVSFNDTTVSATDLGAVNTTEKTAIINWASGKTDDGNNLRPNRMGDPLHSQPAVVSYGGSNGTLAYIGTNEGYLHAVDVDTGNEKFAFIPRSLLGNLKTFKEDILGTDRPYGLDGPITVYRKDANGNGQIVAGEHNAAGEYDEVILIVSMRRGGNQMFAIDVTNPNAPSLLWQITGGSGQFPALGQTWSTPDFIQIKSGDVRNPTKEDVLVFAGGYDEQYDDVTFSSAVPNSSVTGNAIYAVDLHTGALRWSAIGTTGSSVTATASLLQIPEMDDAIPADLWLTDTDWDGVNDRIYAIDVVGRIFRIDFNAIQDVDTNGSTTRRYLPPQGRILADLSGANRRYYNAVQVSYSREGTKEFYYLNVGSGFRAHPLDMTSQDMFFSVKDENVRKTLPADFSTITVSDLTATDTLPLPAGTSIAKGWYFRLATGEKSLSASNSGFGNVFFTTYTPPTPPDTPTCTAPEGTAKSYAVSLYDSQPLDTDRYVVLHSTGIPSSPYFVVLSNSGSNNPTPDNPLASTDRSWYIKVGTENAVNPDLLANKLDAFKLYWQPVEN